MQAANPFVIAGASGRDPATVAMLLELCEFLGMPALRSPHDAYLCFLMDHPLYLGSMVTCSGNNTGWKRMPMRVKKDKILRISMTGTGK